MCNLRINLSSMIVNAVKKQVLFMCLLGACQEFVSIVFQMMLYNLRICTQFELTFVVQEPMTCMMNESYYMLVIWLPYIFEFGFL